MTHAVILSDQFDLSDLIVRSLEQASWKFTHLTFQSMLVHKQVPDESTQCLLVFIDSRFHERYSDWIKALERVVMEFKQELPVFILFEHGYHDMFSSWLCHTTRIFQHIKEVDKRATALKQILDTVEIMR